MNNYLSEIEKIKEVLEAWSLESEGFEVDQDHELQKGWKALKELERDFEDLRAAWEMEKERRKDLESSVVDLEVQLEDANDAARERWENDD